MISKKLQLSGAAALSLAVNVNSASVCLENNQLVFLDNAIIGEGERSGSWYC
ncbi:MAG: hypothetical protein ACI93R_003542 [Flavobacteriales bacterium]|jgi:hypothetical protein